MLATDTSTDTERYARCERLLSALGRELAPRLDRLQLRRVLEGPLGQGLAAQTQRQRAEEEARRQAVPEREVHRRAPPGAPLVDEQQVVVLRRPADPLLEPGRPRGR